MSNLLLGKITFAILLMLWVWRILRKRKKEKYFSSAISEADAKECYQWRYFRWGFRLVQVICGGYFVWLSITFLLS
ncbi:hypothetical protein LJPFL01_2832 [Lelliottia jeotgali]|jgi:hypothetical protein|nr:hypothetical protein LJPFL01_2832 [Lelliottia jeotgali]POZ16057.1 hypothetical protein C3Z09_11875 [Lelliottia aquatilis]